MQLTSLESSRFYLKSKKKSILANVQQDDDPRIEESPSIPAGFSRT